MRELVKSSEDPRTAQDRLVQTQKRAIRRPTPCRKNDSCGWCSPLCSRSLSSFHRVCSACLFVLCYPPANLTRVFAHIQMIAIRQTDRGAGSWVFDRRSYGNYRALDDENRIAAGRGQLEQRERQDRTSPMAFHDLASNLIAPRRCHASTGRAAMPLSAKPARGQRWSSGALW